MIRRTLYLLSIFTLSTHGWSEENNLKFLYERGLKDLPGLHDLVLDPHAYLSTQLRTEPSFLEVLLDDLKLSPKLKYHKSCAQMLRQPTPENQLELSRRAREYFGAKSSTESLNDYFQILPAIGPVQRDWLNALSRYLINLPKPVELYVKPQFSGNGRAFVQGDSETGKISLHLDLSEHQWPPSQLMGHEFFHIRQVQGRWIGDSNVWPEHAIHLPKSGQFPVAEDFSGDGQLFIEEIGAILHDSIFYFRKGTTKPAVLAISVASELTEAADHLYEEALSLWFDPKVRRSTHLSFTQHGTLIKLKGGKFLIFYGSVPSSQSREEWVQAELRRGQQWVQHYSEFMRKLF